MENREHKGQFDPQEALKHNPRINKRVIQKYQDLEKRLEKLGVSTTPRFSLNPPLGDYRIRLHNRPR